MSAPGPAGARPADAAPRPRIAVLVSGRGSNLQAVLDAIAEGDLAARVVGVFSDRPGCAALARAPGVPAWARDPRDFAGREAFDAALGSAVADVDPDWVVCAGYMRLLGPGFVQRFRGRLLNIHPSLLPAYRGLRTHARAIADGVREHGASVHFVSPELDAGAVVAHAVLPVAPGETPAALAARVLELEHPLLVATLRLAASGRLAEHDGIAVVDGHPLFRPLRLESDGCLSRTDGPPAGAGPADPGTPPRRARIAVRPQEDDSKEPE